MASVFADTMRVQGNRTMVPQDVNKYKVHIYTGGDKTSRTCILPPNKPRATRRPLRKRLQGIDIYTKRFARFEHVCCKCVAHLLLLGLCWEVDGDDSDGDYDDHCNGRGRVTIACFVCNLCADHFAFPRDLCGGGRAQFFVVRSSRNGHF